MGNLSKAVARSYLDHLVDASPLEYGTRGLFDTLIQRPKVPMAHVRESLRMRIAGFARAQ